MDAHCRLCLDKSEKLIPIDDVNLVTYRQKVQIFLPEVAIDLVDYCGLCPNCTVILREMYEFKLKCLRTEELIKKYMQNNNITGQVSLKNVVDSQNVYKNCIEFVQCNFDDYPDEEKIIKVNFDEIKKEANDLHSSIEVKSEVLCESGNDVNERNVNGNYKCDICEGVFFNFLKFEKHRKSHTSLTCKKCDKVFNSKYNYERHILKHITECELCGKVYSSRGHLRAHLADIHNCTDETGRHKCLICKAAFYTSNALHRHEATIHEIVQDANNKSNDAINKLSKSFAVHKATIKCDDCRKMFTSNEKLEQHRITHKRECDLCKKVLSRNSILRTHMADVHGCSEKNGKYKCEHCDLCFYTENAKMKHLEVHCVKKGYPCNTCKKEFPTKLTLNTHVRIHTDGNNFECEYCHTKFARKCVLITHLRRHTGEKPYKCEKCGKTFTQHGSLSTHVRYIHSTEKRFSCNVCQMKFKYRASLRFHIQKHTGNVEKAHVCDVCGKAFRVACVLRSHMMRHTNVKNCICMVCGIRFVDTCGLRRHMITHSGEKPHQCHLCTFRCNQKSNLRIHIKSHLKKLKTVT